MTYKWYAALLILAVFTGIQLFRPAIEVRPVTADLAAPDTVRSVFRQACYDCHSNETRLSWFDQVAPGSWLVAKDIREGRMALNFSEWDRLTPERQKGILLEAYIHIRYKAMPLPAYLLVHPGKRVSDRQMGMLSGYLQTLMIRPAPDSMGTRRWQEQYERWIRGGYVAKNITPAPNGLSFIDDYNDWVAISTTVRKDNGTLKMILGNAVAVAAVRSGRINPWPDGSILAKVTWVQKADATGAIDAGEFKQVAFMAKDARKYRSTGGWGFSQWDMGFGLTPHGKDALFTTACVHCHLPMRDNDLVFTVPVAPSMIPGPDEKVIGMSADEAQHTMSTLYGNDTAVRHARSWARQRVSPEAAYPAGSILTLMTWHRQEDDHWPGAEIPGVVTMVEKVKVAGIDGRGSLPVYERYEGMPLQKVAAFDADYVKERIRMILDSRACVLPTSRASSTRP